MGRIGCSGADIIKDEHGLTIEWREVCEHFLADPERQKTRAYDKVYNKDGHLSSRTTQPKSSRFFKRPEVQKYINLRISQMMAKYNVTQDNVVKEWGYLCFSDPRKLFAEDGNLLPPAEWDEGVAASISSVKVSTARNSEGKLEQLKEIRFWDKNKALGDAGRHLNMFQKDNEASAPKVVPDRLNDAQKKAEEQRAKLKLVRDS